MTVVGVDSGPQSGSSRRLRRRGRELGYATTTLPPQGRTVDHAFTLLDGPVDAATVYVPMTRGRCSNQLLAVVTDEETAVDVAAAALRQRWADQPAHTHRACATQPTLSAPERWLGAEELRVLFEESARLGRERTRSIEARARAPRRPR